MDEFIPSGWKKEQLVWDPLIKEETLKAIEGCNDPFLKNWLTTMLNAFGAEQLNLKFLNDLIQGAVFELADTNRQTEILTARDKCPNHASIRITLPDGNCVVNRIPLADLQTADLNRWLKPSIKMLIDGNETN